MTSQTGQNIITVYTLANISRSKGNQMMRFVLLIEHNMRNIFLEKSYTICSKETSQRPFYKKSKLSMSLDLLSEMLHCLFLLFVQVEVYQKILKRSLNNKQSSGSSLPVPFSA